MDSGIAGCKDSKMASESASLSLLVLLATVLSSFSGSFTHTVATMAYVLMVHQPQGRVHFSSAVQAKLLGLTLTGLLGSGVLPEHNTVTPGGQT